MSSMLEGVGGWKSKPEGSERALFGVGGCGPESESVSLESAARLCALGVRLEPRPLLTRSPVCVEWLVARLLAGVVLAESPSKPVPRRAPLGRALGVDGRMGEASRDDARNWLG